jgi:hypothetical protein
MEDQSQYIIPKPWRYGKKWLVWPDTVMDFIQISDCSDTINGICLSNKTVQECIETCDAGGVGGSCAAGYYVQFPNGKSMCVPIRTELHEYLNPIYRLKRQTIYPDLNNVRVSTYVNTELYPFPPESANVVFYRDILSLKYLKTGGTAKTKEATVSGKGSIYITTDNGDDNIQILPTQVSGEHVLQYIPVRYGDAVQFSVPGTSLLAKESGDEQNILQWLPSQGVFNQDDMAFRIMPENDRSKIGDVVTYEHNFIIQYTDMSMVTVNPAYGSLELTYVNNDEKSVFTFVSKMMGYYCDGGKCKPIPINDMETIGEAGRYKGLTVERNPGCWGVCNYIGNGNFQKPYSTRAPTSNAIWYILGIILIIILSIIVVFVRRK